MTLLESLYTAAVHAVEAASPLLEYGEGKLARGLRARRGVVARMAEWAARERDPARPLVWFHASSVGEGLQARAVLERFRRRRSEAQLAYTFFSPSAEGFASRMPADLADYLPLDLPGEVEGALNALRPEVIAFSKYDVWPNLCRAAAARGIRLALLSATLPPSSSRLRGPARALLAPTYARLDAVAAISPADAERFARLDVPAARRGVMGDARFDQVWERRAGVDPGSELLRPLRDPERVTLVAGSTWPPDEVRLVAAWARLKGPRRLILVPHEPTAAHLAATEALVREQGLNIERLGAGARAAEAEVLLVDRVGVLGELYALAEVAYVGGGWGAAGIHSVLEPAAFGVPVLFGPRHANAREAAELVAAGGAFAEGSVEALEDRLRALLRDAAERRTAGERARRYVQAGLGAAERGAEVVEGLLREPSISRR